MVTNRYGLLSLLFLCGCPDRPDIDLDPPRIIGVEPAASPVPISVSFRLRFSEVINVKTVQRDDGAAVVVIVDRADATESFVSDLDNPPLSDSRLDALVPVSLVLEGAGAELVVVPVSPLLPGRAYTLLVSADVRDTSGNPLYGPSGANEAFRLDFTTDDGPPTLVYEDVSRGLVVPNRRYFHLAFDQPVRGLGGPTLTLVGLDAAATAHPIPTEAVLISADRTQASLVLGESVDGSCERLAPSAAYELRIGPGLTDDEGEEMGELRLSFSTSAACDLVPNTLLESPSAAPTDIAATVRFETSKASSTEVRFGASGGPLDCLLQTPCPVLGAPSLLPQAGTTPPRFLHEVLLTGLVVGEAYDFSVRAEDETGSSAVGVGSFVTAPLPAVALNEVMGNPVTEPAGEYLELINYSDTETYALAGWSVVIAGSGDTGRTCVLSSAAPSLAPGQFLLLVPGASSPLELYGIDPAKTFALSESSQLCGPIPNGEARRVLLLDAEGRAVSSFAGYPGLDHDEDGRSVERIAPDAPDVATSFCYSRADAAPTPAAPNSVTLRGCDP